MKKALIFIFALIVVVAVAGVYLYASLDNIIRTAIEQIGSDLTQTQVVLDAVEISPTSGSGALRGFRVTNPQGFSDDDAFRFSEVSVSVDISTIRSDPVLIREMVIDGPRIVYEFAGGTSNLDTLKGNVERKTGDAGGDRTAGGGNGPKIVIENLYLRNGRVGVSAPVLAQRKEVPLPTVHLTGIGRDGKGATPAQVAQAIVDAILANARKAATDANLDLGELRKTAGELADAAKRRLDDTSKGIGDAAGQGADETGKALDGLVKGIGGN
jgi:hypothetical protein